MLTFYLRSFVQLFYPSICPGCGEELVTGEGFICIRCNTRMAPAAFPSATQNPVFGLFAASLPLEGAVAGFYYSRGSIIQQLIYRVKYNGRKKTAVWLGKRLGEILKSTADLPDIDVIVPVPLHPSKLKRRGFNQCDLICAGVAGELGHPVWNHALVRSQGRSSQTHKSRIDRWESTRHSFSLNPQIDLRGKTVLLVDDVVTTGATMLACAKTLVENGDCRICLAAIAVSGEL